MVCCFIVVLFCFDTFQDYVEGFRNGAPYCHIQLHTKKVASVAKATWHRRVQRFIETKTWLSGLGAAADQRHPAFVPRVGRSYMGIKGKRRNPS